MNRRRFSSTALLINDLLDRYERGAGSTRPIASIDNEGFTTVDQRDAFDEVLEALERSGGLDLIRTGRGSDRVVTGARLKNATLLYAQVGRQPARKLIDDAMVQLRARHCRSPELASVLDDAASAWARGVSFLGVARNDIRTLDQVIGLAQAVHGRRAGPMSDEVDFRTFSRLAVSDSKALERNVRGVVSMVSLLFRTDPRSLDLEPEEFLGSVGVKRLPQPVLIRGALTLDGQPMPELPFLGIPTESVGRVELSEPPDYLITIENYASFVRYVREVARDDRGLVIYSGGFPSRPTLEIITRFAAAAKVPTYHWGDMDAGGVRIFYHVERRLRAVGVELRPHMMDVELLEHFGTPSMDASRVTGDVDGSAVAGLAAFIRETGLVHEQEEFCPRRPGVV